MVSVREKKLEIKLTYTNFFFKSKFVNSSVTSKRSTTLCTTSSVESINKSSLKTALGFSYP